MCKCIGKVIPLELVVWKGKKPQWIKVALVWLSISQCVCVLHINTIARLHDYSSSIHFSVSRSHVAGDITAKAIIYRKMHISTSYAVLVYRWHLAWAVRCNAEVNRHIVCCMFRVVVYKLLQYLEKNARIDMQKCLQCLE